MAEHLAQHAAAPMPQGLWPGPLGVEPPRQLAVDRLDQPVPPAQDTRPLGRGARRWFWDGANRRLPPGASASRSAGDQEWRSPRPPLPAGGANFQTTSVSAALAGARTAAWMMPARQVRRWRRQPENLWRSLAQGGRRQRGGGGSTRIRERPDRSRGIRRPVRWPELPVGPLGREAALPDVLQGECLQMVVNQAKDSQQIIIQGPGASPRRTARFTAVAEESTLTY